MFTIVELLLHSKELKYNTIDINTKKIFKEKGEGSVAKARVYIVSIYIVVILALDKQCSYIP